MSEPRILVVDDEACSAAYLVQALEEEFDGVQSASAGVKALLVMEQHVPGLVITDLHMPGMDGLQLLVHVKERWPEVPVIVVTVDGETAAVVEAVQRGAINYLVKPVSPAVLRSAARRALITIASPHATTDGAPEILGVSPAMVEVRHRVALAARNDVNVLITGDTGTGKELVARAIYRLSSDASVPFVAHNCAATPPGLFESELFGHRRGAFTGADRDRAGLLEEADGGILFLDELEALSLPHQAKLLRVLDDGEVRAVGSSEKRLVSVRFLAATNRDPAKMLAEEALRDDLYYRLRGFEIHLPPLTERREDIPLLAAHFLESDQATLCREALDALHEFAWPGNVRQLRNTIQSAHAQARDGRIWAWHLGLGSAPGHRIPNTPETPPGAESAGVPPLRELEREAILRALERFQGNRSRAARALGIDRSTLRRKLKEHSIDPEYGRNGTLWSGSG